MAKAESITFKTTNTSSPVRTFSAKDHGKDWKKVAEEFAATHANSIVSRSDEEDS